MNHNSAGCLGALGLLALAVFCPTCRRVPIETYLKGKAEAALTRDGLIGQPGKTDWSVGVDGLDVNLFGPTDTATRAKSIVQNELSAHVPWFFDVNLLGQSGATPSPTPSASPVASASPAPSASPKPEAVVATGNTTGLVQVLSYEGIHYVRGVYPDDGSRQAAVRAVQTAFGGTVKDETTLSGSGGEFGWPEQPLKTLAALKGVRNLELSAGGDVVTLAGLVSSDAERQKLGATIKATLPSGVTLENQLTLAGEPRLVPEPSSASALPETERQKAQAQLNAVVASGEVLFATASSRIKPEAYPYLNQITEALKAQSGATVVVGGHTDGEGDSAPNRILSQKRADSVRAYLVSRGIPSVHLFARGYGSSQPIASNATEEGRRRNRRTGFTVR